MRIALIISAIMLTPATAVAQMANYPTNIPGVKAPGQVPLQCDANGKNCAPPPPGSSTGQVATGTASPTATPVQAANGEALATKANQATQIQAEQTTAQLLAGPLTTATRGDLDQLTTRLGVSYSIGTGIVSIPANNFLNVVFSCAAPSGSVCIVYLRGYGNGSTAVLQYQNFRGSTAISGGTTKAAGNKSQAATAVASGSTLTFATAATTIATGTPAVTDFIYPTSENILTPSTVLKPGDTIAVSITGAGGALASAANAEVKIIWAELPL